MSVRVYALCIPVRGSFEAIIAEDQCAPFARLALVRGDRARGGGKAVGGVHAERAELQPDDR